jgi:hypothetical protein
MTEQNKKCTGRYDPVPFGTKMHQDCFGCQRKAVRENSSHNGFYQSPSSPLKDDKCEAKK